jgi:hypothetical protein
MGTIIKFKFLVLEQDQINFYIKIALIAFNGITIDNLHGVTSQTVVGLRV